ncbi:hypothetical protein PJ985_13335 [Streptomyces sp. ACA25]|uniref:hypothetical protein n=1 Tax=Streptomyces sp. ACA25 TaxID=3022596 RepID=UPI0023072ECB|nr:hypothetical protein [Streptomyces sp. ACA25]MDB1088551.1 hypothetical protein [Streptomyces sp. ACA25]
MDSERNLSGKIVPVVHPQQVEEELYIYASRIYDGLATQGRSGGHDRILASPCGGDWNNKSVYSLTLLWMLDEVELSEQHLAVHRLHDYLRSQGWDIDRAELLPRKEWSSGWSTLRASNHTDGYSVDVETITHMNRIGLTVSSPCTRLPEGASEPHTKDAKGMPAF